MPGDYEISAYYGSENCIASEADINETVSIKAKTTLLQIVNYQVDSVTCLSAKNGKIAFQIMGWDEGYTTKVNDNLISPINIESETASFEMTSLEEGYYKIITLDNCEKIGRASCRERVSSQG